MITIEANVDKTFIASVNTLVQNTTGRLIKYATDPAQPEWFHMKPSDIPLQVLAGDTVYFRSPTKTALAEMPML